MSLQRQLELIVSGNLRDVKTVKGKNDEPKQSNQKRKSKPKSIEIWVSEEVAVRNAISKDDY